MKTPQFGVFPSPPESRLQRPSVPRARTKLFDRSGARGMEATSFPIKECRCSSSNSSRFIHLRMSLIISVLRCKRILACSESLCIFHMVDRSLEVRSRGHWSRLKCVWKPNPVGEHICGRLFRHPTRDVSPQSMLVPSYAPHSSPLHPNGQFPVATGSGSFQVFSWSLMLQPHNALTEPVCVYGRTMRVCVR